MRRQLQSCWLNFNTENKVFKGSTDYIQNGYNESNDAVNKIIEIETSITSENKRL